MMLDDPRAIERVDRHDTRRVLTEFPAHCRRAQALQPMPLPAAVRPRLVVVAGMGGSAAGGDLVAACASDTLDVPLLVHRGYGLPAAAGPESLVVALSYSGDTAEVLSAVEVALRRGIPVVAVDTGLLSTGRRSRYARSYLSSPPFDSADWSDWLLALGRDGVRRAIYATSDAVSFALADRREELSSVFDLYQPSLETMMCILDKGLLHRHARAVGIETPETWFPQSADDADRIVREVGGQIVAKPRSQLCASSGAKVDPKSSSSRRDPRWVRSPVAITWSIPDSNRAAQRCAALASVSALRPR
jgi:hypothetical protein